MGRPPIGRLPHKPRQLGRVSDSDWEVMRAAAERSGQTFTRWACEILLRAARKQLTKEVKP